MERRSSPREPGGLETRLVRSPDGDFGRGNEKTPTVHRHARGAAIALNSTTRLESSKPILSRRTPVRQGGDSIKSKTRIAGSIRFRDFHFDRFHKPIDKILSLIFLIIDTILSILVNLQILVTVVERADSRGGSLATVILQADRLHFKKSTSFHSTRNGEEDHRSAPCDERSGFGNENRGRSGG